MRGKFLKGRVVVNKSIILIVVEVIVIAFICNSAYPLLVRNIDIKNLSARRYNTAVITDGQGVYESCSPALGSVCIQRLQKIAQGGFSLVLNYDQLYATEAQEIAYAQAAKSLHMKIIWAMSDPQFWNGSNLLRQFKDLALSCRCSDNKGFLSYVVKLIKVQPATWGYYIGDEVPTANHSQVKMFSDAVRTLDPTHPRLFVASGEDGTNGASLSPFTDTAEVLGDDIYPIGTTSESIALVGTVALSVQRVTSTSKRQSMMVLQAFSWSQYSRATWRCAPFPACATYPTSDQMLQMINNVLQYSSPRLVLWYSFFDIMKSDAPDRHWSDLLKAASPVNPFL